MAAAVGLSRPHPSVNYSKTDNANNAWTEKGPQIHPNSIQSNLDPNTGTPTRVEPGDQPASPQKVTLFPKKKEPVTVSLAQILKNCQGKKLSCPHEICT